MDEIDKKAQYVVFFGLVVYVVYCVLGIVTERCLYADGSQFFITVINDRMIYSDENMNRFFVNCINQLPLLIVLKSGISDIHILKLVFGGTLFFQNLIGMLILFFISSRHKKYGVLTISLLAYSFFNMLSEIFIISEAIISYWLFFVIFFYTFPLKRYRMLDYVILGSSLVLLFKSYEGVLVYGGVIILSALMNLYRHNKKYCGIIVGTVGLAMLYMMFWMIGHAAEAATGGYLDTFINVFKNYDSTVRSNLLISIAGLMFLKICYKKTKTSLQYRLLLTALVLGIVFVCIGQYRAEWVDPVKEYQYRVFIVFGGAFVMLLYAGAYKVRFEFKRYVNYNNLYSTIFLVLSLQSIWQIGNCFYWNEYREYFIKQVNASSQSIIAPERTLSRKTYDRYEWEWNQSVLSIALMEKYQVDKIVMPRKSYMNFFSLDAKKPMIPFLDINQEVFDIHLLAEGKEEDKKE